MRTPAGLSIRKLEWPRKVIETPPSGTPPASCNSPSRPATTPVHAACAADAISEASTTAHTGTHRVAELEVPLTLPLRGSLPLPARGERAGVRGPTATYSTT